MTKFKRTNKLPMEEIIVVKGNLAPPTGKFTTSGSSLNFAAANQLGILSWDFDSSVRALGNFIQSGDDSNEVQAIKIVGSTPASLNVNLADPWQANDQAYLQSGIIRKTNIRSVAVKKARYAQYGGQVITDFTAPLNDTAYSATLRLLSVKNDRWFGDNDEVISATSGPAVNFTTLGTTNPLDYVLQRLAYNFNLQSKAVSVTNNGLKKGNRNFVVFGVKLAGGSGVVLNNVAPGTSIPFMTVNGVSNTLVADIPLVQTLAYLVQDSADLLGTSTIENIDITTAGAAAKIDALIVVGLPRTLAAAYDDVEQAQTKPEINLAGGFRLQATPFTVTNCAPNEGTGQGSKWLINWRHRAGLVTHTKQIQPMGDYFIEGKSYIDPDNLYASYIIEYFDTEEVLSGTEVSPKRIVLLFRNEVASAFTINVANVVTRIAGGNTPINIITSNDAGTGTAGTTLVTAVEAILTAWLEHARTTGNPFTVTGDAVAGGAYLS